MGYRDSSKYRDKQVHLVREAAINDIMKEVERASNTKRRDPYNIDIWNKGMQWFEAGLLLADADESIKYNTNFIDGYAFGERKDLLNRKFMEMGRDWYLVGHQLEDANKVYLENEFFVQGYESAKGRKR